MATDATRGLVARGFRSLPLRRRCLGHVGANRRLLALVAGHRERSPPVLDDHDVMAEGAELGDQALRLARIVFDEEKSH